MTASMRYWITPGWKDKMEKMVLETERLFLREMNMDDVEAL